MREMSDVPTTKADSLKGCWPRVAYVKGSAVAEEISNISTAKADSSNGRWLRVLSKRHSTEGPCVTSSIKQKRAAMSIMYTVNTETFVR
jgi:hypothetical protein